VDLESKSSKLKPRGDYVRLSRVPGHRGMPDDEPILLKEVVIDDSADGEVIGLLRLSRAGCSWMHAAMQQLKVQNPKGRLVLTDIIRSVLKAGHSVRVQPIWGNWVDVNDLKDLAAASRY
jgi:hypothetical protein